MDISNLLKEFPIEGSTLIATTFALLGWILRNLFQVYIENKRYNKEIRTYFWKEKINAAKKASEYYLEILNLFDLIKTQFKLYESGSIEHEKLYENIEKEVEYYRTKLKSFPHLEYHHINLFYEFDELKSSEINNKTIEIQQKVFDLLNETNLSANELEIKFKEYSSVIKNNYSELHKIYKKYLKEVRQDINKYI